MLSESAGSEACCLQDLRAPGLAVRSRPLGPLGEPVREKEDRLGKAVAPVATGVPRPQDFPISNVYCRALPEIGKPSLWLPPPKLLFPLSES